MICNEALFNIACELAKVVFNEVTSRTISAEEVDLDEREI